MAGQCSTSKIHTCCYAVASPVVANATALANSSLPFSSTGVAPLGVVPGVATPSVDAAALEGTVIHQPLGDRVIVCLARMLTTVDLCMCVFDLPLT